MVWFEKPGDGKSIILDMHELVNLKYHNTVSYDFKNNYNMWRWGTEQLKKMMYY